jgi:hypothetical protein
MELRIDSIVEEHLKKNKIVTSYWDFTGFWFPLKKKLKKGRRYFGVAAVPETLFPQCRQ